MGPPRRPVGRQWQDTSRLSESFCESKVDKSRLNINKINYLILRCGCWWATIKDRHLGLRPSAFFVPPGKLPEQFSACAVVSRLARRDRSGP